MKKVSASSIWFEKYKPKTVEDLILPQDLKNKLLNQVKTQQIPHLLLCSNTGGTGKSVTCNSILTDIGGEALWINASLDNGIDTLRGKIAKFASSSSFDDNLKIVVMDEFDHMSQSAMAAFRGFLDEFGNNCTFIFTCNFKDKIIEPLLTRLQIIDYNSFDKTEMVKPIFERLKFILENENIQYDQKDLIPVINTYYPSIRSMVGALQKYSHNGEFKVSESELDDTNVFDKIMGKCTVNTFNEMIVEVNKVNSPDGMFSFLYKNLSKYFKAEAIPQVIVILAKYQHMSSSVRDKNLNLGAALTELIRFR